MESQPVDGHYMLQEKKKNTDKVQKHTDSVTKVFCVILNNFFFAQRLFSEGKVEVFIIPI